MKKTCLVIFCLTLVFSGCAFLEKPKEPPAMH